MTCTGLPRSRACVTARVARAAARVAVALFAAGVLPACVKPTPAQQAMALARGHREDEAIAKLRAELAAHPGDVEARAMLVRLLAFAGDRAGAQVAATELAMRLPSGDPRAWIELGHALEVAHDFEGALAAYDVAASVAPASAAGPREGGLRAARWGEIEEAAPRLEEATRRDPKDVASWHALGLVRVHGGDAAGAEAAYRAGIAADPRGAECWLGLATVAVKAGDAGGALAAYDALASLRPRFAGAELGRAWALAKLGRKGDAEKALERAEELGAASRVVARQRAAFGLSRPD
jgi:cytochrome c-type biogenesis protein CcmH/NrfG